MSSLTLDVGMHKSMSEAWVRAVLLKQSKEGKSKLVQHHKHQSRFCTSVRPLVHMSKGCKSPGCHRSTVLNTRNHNLKELGLTSFYSINTPWVSFGFPAVHTLPFSKLRQRLAFAELHTKVWSEREVHFMTEGPSLVCLSVHLTQTYKRRDFNTLLQLSDRKTLHLHG